MKSILFLSLALVGTSAFAQGYPTETQEVKNLVQNTAIHASYHYCVEGTLTCRTLVLLKDKVTGQSVPDFYDVFLSSERAVGSTGYFLANPNGTHRAVLDDTFNGQVDITVKYEQNAALSVSYSNGMPTVHNVYLKRLGTTRHVIADMSYSATEAKIVGTEYDTADPQYQQPVNATYKRVN